MDCPDVSGMAQAMDVMTMGKKILYIFDADDWNSRFPVALEAKKRGHSVTIGLIGNQRENSDFKLIPLTKPSGIMSALRMLQQIFKLIKTEKPDILHTVTLKYAMICGIAALSFPKMHKIFTLAGLGYLFHGDNMKSFALRKALKPLMAFLFRRKSTVLIFQNPDDQAQMIKEHYAKEQDCILIRGSGVDIDRFNVFIKPEEPPIVLMPTRLVHEKGIHVFIDAARILKKKGIQARFQIAGGETTHNPRAISAAQMKEMISCGSVEWLGRVSDMPGLLSRSTLIVYPSYYGEGIPRVLLEACAAGKAIVTTDHTGCREAVVHNLNGILVPVKDPQATAEAIERILKDETMRKNMEAHSRERAETEFDIAIIAGKTASIYDNILI